MLMCILINTIFRYYIPQKQRYFYILGLCGILTAIWIIVLRSLLLSIKADSLPYIHFVLISIPIRMGIGFLILGAMSLICILWYILQDQHDYLRRRTEAEKLTREAELYKLRQQLQPHFLFNSLNSINALIGTRPQQARTMIQQLSDFLRGTLKKEDNQWVSLDEELQHLQLYLDIEKVRFGHRLSTIVTNQTAGLRIFMPSMLLQPIVENAIKFGLYDTTDDIIISINASLKEDQLILNVENPYDPSTLSKTGTGFGLKSVQRRLYLLFARNDLLETSADAGHFITTIKIPQHDQGNHNR